MPHLAPHRRLDVRLGVAATVVGLALTACTASKTDPDESDGNTPTRVSADVDYNPQPYADIRNGGTLRVSQTVIEQGNPFQADANLYAQRQWFWYNADAITYSPTGAVQYNPDYFSHVTVAVRGGKQTVTIDINPKATFNDGTPIDYRALAATWRASNGSDPAYNGGNTIPYSRITSVRAGTSSKQAVISFRRVDPWWSSLFTSFLNPKAAASAKTFNTAYVSKAQPQWGTGPYELQSYNARTGDAVFVRNPRWWGKRGKLDKRVVVGLDQEATLNAFANRELDYAPAGSSADGVTRVTGVRGTTVRRGGSPFEYYLFANAQAPLLKDVAVRKAVLTSIDRRQIAQIEFQGLNYREPLPGSAFLYSFQKGYQDNVSKVVPFDPKAAAATLDAAGWKAGSDGIRTKNGKRLEIGYSFTNAEPLDRAVANAFAGQLKRVGIKLDLEPTSENDFDSVVSGRKFDLFLAGSRSLDPFGAQNLDGFYGSKNANNLSGAGTPAIDAQIRAAGNIADPDAQIARANQIEREALAQYGQLPLFSGPSIYGVTDKLANVGATIFGTPLPETVGFQK